METRYGKWQMAPGCAVARSRGTFKMNLMFQYTAPVSFVDVQYYFRENGSDRKK